MTEMGPGSSQPTPVSIADPGPLGLAGFAMTTFILSLVNAQVITGASSADFLGLALVYGGAAQFFAGMWEFRKGNTFGALAFGSYGRVLDRSVRSGEVLPRISSGYRVELLPTGLDDFHLLHVDCLVEDNRSRVHGLPRADRDVRTSCRGVVQELGIHHPGGRRLRDRHRDLCVVRILGGGRELHVQENGNAGLSAERLTSTNPSKRGIPNGLPAPLGSRGGLVFSSTRTGRFAADLADRVPTFRSGVAQLAEHAAVNRVVESSSLSPGAHSAKWGRSSVVRAGDS